MNFQEELARFLMILTVVLQSTNGGNIKHLQQSLHVGDGWYLITDDAGDIILCRKIDGGLYKKAYKVPSYPAVLGKMVQTSSTSGTSKTTSTPWFRSNTPLSDRQAAISNGLKVFNRKLEPTNGAYVDSNLNSGAMRAKEGIIELETHSELEDNREDTKMEQNRNIGDSEELAASHESDESESKNYSEIEDNSDLKSTESSESTENSDSEDQEKFYRNWDTKELVLDENTKSAENSDAESAKNIVESINFSKKNQKKCNRSHNQQATKENKDLFSLRSLIPSQLTTKEIDQNGEDGVDENQKDIVVPFIEYPSTVLTEPTSPLNDYEDLSVTVSEPLNPINTVGNNCDDSKAYMDDLAMAKNDKSTPINPETYTEDYSSELRDIEASKDKMTIPNLQHTLLKDVEIQKDNKHKNQSESEADKYITSDSVIFDNETKEEKENKNDIEIENIVDNELVNDDNSQITADNETEIANETQSVIEGEADNGIKFLIENQIGNEREIEIKPEDETDEIIYVTETNDYSKDDDYLMFNNDLVRHIPNVSLNFTEDIDKDDSINLYDYSKKEFVAGSNRTDININIKIEVERKNN